MMKCLLDIAAAPVSLLFIICLLCMVWFLLQKYDRNCNCASFKREMVSCFPSMPKKLAMTVGYFIAGAALFAVGMHLSYVNVAPQQARIKTCNDFVKERLRKKYGKP